MTREPNPTPRAARLPGILALSLAVVVTGCSGNDDRADAYGNFEAVEVLVSSEANGRLSFFRADEGDRLPAGVTVGLVDTTQLALQWARLQANVRAVRSGVTSLRAQIRVLEEKRRVADVDRQRIERLLQEQAATQQQMDDVEGRIAVLDRQIEQTRTQEVTIFAEVEALRVQIEQVRDQIDRATVSNPVLGTVLTTYVEPHELVTYGRPLYRIADLTTMELRAYVSGSQLDAVRIGRDVTVRFDHGNGSVASRAGTVTWIANEAGFTPKLIQTRDERVNLVYAFKVRVDNPDGLLKIGMPGEVWFESE